MTRWSVEAVLTQQKFCFLLSFWPLIFHWGMCEQRSKCMLLLWTLGAQLVYLATSRLYRSWEAATWWWQLRLTWNAPTTDSKGQVYLPSSISFVFWETVANTNLHWCIKTYIHTYIFSFDQEGKMKAFRGWRWGNFTRTTPTLLSILPFCSFFQSLSS